MGDLLAQDVSDDTIWPIVEMHRHNYRVKNDPILLEKIIKTLEPLLEKDISEAIIKCIKAQRRRTFGIKRAKEDELLLSNTIFCETLSRT